MVRNKIDLYEGFYLKKVLILEDNSVARKHLEQIVYDIDVKSIVYSFDNIKDAYQCALEKTIDLFLIDIILDTRKPGDSSGLRFVENIRHINHYEFVPVVIITSLEDAKSYTYDTLHCYHFVEKPFDVESVKDIVRQCFRYPGNNKKARTLYLPNDGILLAVKLEHLVYAECRNHFLYIYTSNKDVLEIPYYTLKKLMDEADCSDIIQCRRNTVFNRKYIKNIDKANRIIQFKNGLGRVEISIMYIKHVLESLGLE